VIAEKNKLAPEVISSVQLKPPSKGKRKVVLVLN